MRLWVSAFLCLGCVGCSLDTVGTSPSAAGDGAIVRMDAGARDAAGRDAAGTDSGSIDAGGLDAGGSDASSDASIVVSDACVPTGAATDICNGLDDDCDGAIDEDEGCGCTSGTSRPCGTCGDGLQTCVSAMWDVCMGGTLLTRYYRDMDGDGYGAAGETMESCAPVAGWVIDATDCNDSCGTCTPVGVEVCDTLDNDCDMVPDDGAGTPWYPDADHDGHGTTVGAVYACASPGAGYVAAAGDCDDACARCHPGYPSELCRDGRDNDCNSMIDESSCPCDLLELSTGHYLYCRAAVSWNTGSTSCMTYGGDLVSLESRAEQDAVWTAVDPYDATVWLGGSDAALEGTWVWQSGATVGVCTAGVCVCPVMCNWRSGQPSGGTADNCMRMRFDGGGQWGDYLCSTPFATVCELPP